MAVSYGGNLGTIYGSIGGGATAGFTNITPPLGSSLVIVATTSNTVTPSNFDLNISDDQGGVYIVAVPLNSTNFNSITWFRTTKSNGNTFSVTISNNGSPSNIEISATYYNGSNGTVTSSTNSNSGALTWTSVTTPATTNAGDLILGIGTGMGGQPTGTSSGFTLPANTIYSNLIQAYAYRVATASGQTYSLTYSGSIPLTYNKVSAFVIEAAPTFAGWGIPLI
jgi:hypothetical protein